MMQQRNQSLRSTIIRSFIGCVVTVIMHGVVYADMPHNGHLPPCSQDEVPDRVCLSYVTAPDGSRMCAPDGMRDICLPAVNRGGDPERTDQLRCQRDAIVCVDTTPSKNINGLTVWLDQVGGCWNYRRDYSCLTNNTVDTCDELRSKSNCAVSTRTCVNQSGPFGCLEWEVEYQCLVKQGTTGSIEYCGDTTICVGGICWDTGYMPDTDFARVITDLEIARQIGIYSSDGVNIFGGDSSSCRSKRGGGLKSCCNTDSSARSNNGYMGEAVSGAAGFAVRAGSKYVFDALYGDTLNWVSSGWAAAIGNNLPGGGNLLDSFSSPGFSMYGFSVGGTGSFLGTAGMNLGSVGGYQMYFNPYAFAFAVGMHIVMQAMTCDESEAMLAQKRGAGLCTGKIGDWCEKAVLGVCITRKQSYYCFNSKLARIINEQGRAQLGKSWGNTQNPTCDGFSVGELGSLNFEHIDLSEFIGDVMGAVDLSHLNKDHTKAAEGDFANSGLEAACKTTYKAVNGDMQKVPKECDGLVP